MIQQGGSWYSNVDPRHSVARSQIFAAGNNRALGDLQSQIAGQILLIGQRILFPRILRARKLVPQHVPESSISLIALNLMATASPRASKHFSTARRFPPRRVLSSGGHSFSGRSKYTLGIRTSNFSAVFTVSYLRNVFTWSAWTAALSSLAS